MGAEQCLSSVYLPPSKVPVTNQRSLWGASEFTGLPYRVWVGETDRIARDLKAAALRSLHPAWMMASPRLHMWNAFSLTLNLP